MRPLLAALARSHRRRRAVFTVRSGRGQHGRGRMTLRAQGYGLALAVFAVDQLVKWAMLGPLALREIGQIVLLPIFNLSYVENHGVSLGLFTASSDAQRWLLVALTAAIAAGVAVWIAREKNRWDVVALGLVLGGALGNILDRARL